MRRLPPLSAVEAFVHVARLGSIKAAAGELALSSPALSRRVQALERFMGKALFDRRHQAIVLNPDGERLLVQIAPALDSMSDAIDAMTSGGELLRLRLGLLPLYASQRLMPRLGELKRAHPELHLDVDTQPNRQARLGDSLDAAIVLAREIDPALYARRLDRNRVFVIGSERLLTGADPIARPEQMRRLTALVHRDMPETFIEWRRAMGVPELEPRTTDYFDSGPLMLEAAAQGLGVAFMLEMHFEGAQDRGLVRLFDPVDSDYSYWFVCRPRALQTRAVKIFHDWVLTVLNPEPAGR
jgi:LysR family transcriptional regulator, glycine cleavage system transcriptional activator